MHVYIVCYVQVNEYFFVASFSAGSSAASREILVQHLLVKEDDLKLLVELQKRVSEGKSQAYCVCYYLSFTD